jgi:hypothetical protein
MRLFSARVLVLLGKETLKLYSRHLNVNKPDVVIYKNEAA